MIAWRRRRVLGRGACVDAQLAELRSALERLGWHVPRETTLLALEQRFAAAGRSAVVNYTEGLRLHRFAAAPTPPPGASSRRALREALSRGGPLRRLRGFIAIPPGGPGRRQRT